MKDNYKMIIDFDDELKKLQDEYDILEKTVEIDIEIRDKKLENALAPQASIQYKWGKLAASLAWLFEEAKNEADTAFGEAYVLAQSDNYKSVSSTDAKWFAEKDDNYNDAVRMKNKIYRLKKQVDNIADVIESRKYILKDLTASIINQVNNARLD